MESRIGNRNRTLCDLDLRRLMRGPSDSVLVPLRQCRYCSPQEIAAEEAADLAPEGPGVILKQTNISRIEISLQDIAVSCYF